MILIKDCTIKVFSVSLVKVRSIPKEILAQKLGNTVLESTAEQNENKGDLSHHGHSKVTENYSVPSQRW